MSKNIIKKSLLTLGSVFALNANYTYAAFEDMSFGARLGGCISPSIVSANVKGKQYEGRLKGTPTGNAFFAYRVSDDVSLGLDVGYVNNGLSMSPSSPADDNDDYALNVHSLQLNVPVHWMPMEREGGLLLGLKFSTLMSLKTSEKIIGGAGAASVANNDIAKPFNFGGGVDVRYEIDETGFMICGEYTHFFSHFFDKDSAGAQNWATAMGGVDLAKQNRLQLVQITLGYDFSRLLED